MTHTRTAFLAPAFALALLTGTASADLALDDYTTQIGGAGLDISLGEAGDFVSATDLGIPLLGTIGDRTTTLTVTHVLPQLPFGDIDAQTFTLTNPVDVDGNYTVQPGNFLNINSGLGLSGFEIELSYDFTGVDLLALGNAFEFELGSGDFDIDNRPDNPAFLPFEITLTSGSDSASASTLVSDEGMYSIDFSAYSGVDLSNITNVTVTFGGEVVTPDLLLGTVRVIPAPGGLAMLGVIGLVGGRRRRG